MEQETFADKMKQLLPVEHFNNEATGGIENVDIIGEMQKILDVELDIEKAEGRRKVIVDLTNGLISIMQMR